jgi:4'-phosphopantetheinyl transferase
VHVWCRATGDGDRNDAHDTDLRHLSADERAQCDRFIFARDRRDFAAAHALLRDRLSQYGGVDPAAWTFDTAPGGKPFIVSASGEPALAFNLSHTRGFVACVIAAAGDLGIDVESVGRALDGRRIAERYFSTSECDWLDACDARERDIRFIELWTLKEAYIKAIGRGLSHPLDAFAFTFEGDQGLRFHPAHDTKASAWTFALFAPSPKYRMAVAVGSAALQHGSLVARSADGTVARAIRESGAQTQT